jgi:hypothetical protein
VTRIIMASTILAFATFSAIAWWFEKGKPGEAVSAGLVHCIQNPAFCKRS